MKSRFLANFCLTLLLLFAQHVALADAFSRHARQAAVCDETAQCVLEEGAASSPDSSDTGNHVSLDDLDGGLISTFFFPASVNSAPFTAHTLFSDYFTVLSQYYSTRAPPAL
ncbi:MAG TPA: hypothetical protein VGO72_05685 [Herminiimonas sp.]|jgi:hypothetical protein|nr:hypothetical protein [Herminiimonas sp.]